MKLVREVYDCRAVLRFSLSQRTARSLNGFLRRPSAADHDEQLNIRQVESFVGQRGGNHGPQVSGFEFFHRQLALLLADLGMDKQRTWNRRLVFLSQRDARDEDERLHIQMLQRVVDGVLIPLAVLADADVHKRFPSAHAF